MLTLYAATGSCSRASHIALEESGLAYEVRLVDFAKAEQPWVRALLDACADALPFLAAGDDERYQAEVMRLAPADKSDIPQGRG